jgi:uncharacterized membrane protein YcaP (DUF421 family)
LLPNRIMFDIEGSKALEIVVRVAFIYLACIVLLRVSGRREMSELSQLDLLVMLLISETVSPALTGGDESITGGAIAATSLFVLYGATGWLAFRYRRVEKLIQGQAAVLIEDGRVLPDVLQKFRITDDDLRTTLHQHGVLHVAEVKRAFIEPDGEITLIKRTDHEEAQPILQRAQPRRHDTLPQ